MKAIITLLFSLPLVLNAQYSFEMEQLDTSNCAVNIYSNGALFNDPFIFQAGYEIPKGTSIHSIYAGGLWLGGYEDMTSNHHIAVNTYTDSVTDFFEGPIASNYDQAYNDKYADVWKISKSDIDQHVQNWNSAGYVVPDVIDKWPAHGDVSNGEPANIAPYVDIDNDNLYNPENGDFPCFKGDQAVFAVFNDERYPHFRSFGKPLGVEVRLMAYAYNTASEINNVVFFDYTIINRSTNNYSDFQAAMWLDFDLGNPYDDYVGCNPSKNLIFAYNGDSFDENSGPVQGYGSNPPAIGVKMLNDSLASFIAYKNGIGPTGDPTASGDYFNYLNGKWKDGSFITHGGQGYGGTQPVEYLYDGSPGDTSQWSEHSEANFPGDRRALGSVIPRSFNAGDTIHMSLAFIYARGINNDNIQNAAYLDSLADVVQVFYDTSGSTCYTPEVVPPTGIETLSTKALEIYPQPADDIIYLKGFRNESIEYEIFTLDGKSISAGETNNQIISVSNIDNGMYVLRIQNDSKQWVTKLAISKGWN